MSKIVSLHAENIKRLKAVHIEPSGSMVVIGGQNDQGKSSVLDSIMYALGGGKSIPPKPLRNGTKKGVIKIDLGELLVERTFTAAGSKLEIKSKDGYEAPTPQKILDDMCGKLAFDPLEFSRQKPKDQLAVLRDLVGLDFSALDDERTKAYATRTSTNRDAKQLEGELAGLPFNDDVSATEVSVADVSDELEQARQTNQAKVAAGQKLDQMRSLVRDDKDAIEESEAELERLQNRIAKLKVSVIAQEAKIDGAVESLDAMPLVELEPIRERLKWSELTNAKVRANAKRADVEQRLARVNQRSEALTERIDAIDSEKESSIQAAKFPVDGLGFADESVTFNGIPFEQASSSQRIRVSAAMGLAMNPELRVMLIRDGSLMGSEALAMLAEMAEAADAQIWVERVSEGEEVSVVIEDGSIKGTAAAESNHQEAAAV